MNTHVHRHYHKHYHSYQFLVLLLLMATGFCSFLHAGGSQSQQMQIGLVTAAAYAVWGIFYHLYDNDLNWKIMVEYGAIGFLGISILWFLLNNIY